MSSTARPLRSMSCVSSSSVRSLMSPCVSASTVVAPRRATSLGSDRRSQAPPVATCRRTDSIADDRVSGGSSPAGLVVEAVLALRVAGVRRASSGARRRRRHRRRSAAARRLARPASEPSPCRRRHRRGLARPGGGAAGSTRRAGDERRCERRRRRGRRARPARAPPGRRPGRGRRRQGCARPLRPARRNASISSPDSARQAPIFRFLSDRGP